MLRDFFSQILQKIFYSAADMRPSKPIEKYGIEESPPVASFSMIMIHHRKGIVDNLESIFPKSTAPINIFHIHKKSWVHRSDFFHR